jgi:hypothetical protein
MQNNFHQVKNQAELCYRWLSRFREASCHHVLFWGINLLLASMSGCYSKSCCWRYLQGQQQPQAVAAGAPVALAQAKTTTAAAAAAALVVVAAAQTAVAGLVEGWRAAAAVVPAGIAALLGQFGLVQYPGGIS